MSLAHHAWCVRNTNALPRPCHTWCPAWPGPHAITTASLLVLCFSVQVLVGLQGPAEPPDRATTGQAKARQGARPPISKQRGHSSHACSPHSQGPCERPCLPHTAAQPQQHHCRWPASVVAAPCNHTRVKSGLLWAHATPKETTGSPLNQNMASTTPQLDSSHTLLVNFLCRPLGSPPVPAKGAAIAAHTLSVAQFKAQQ